MPLADVTDAFEELQEDVDQSLETLMDYSRIIILVGQGGEAVLENSHDFVRSGGMFIHELQKAVPEPITVLKRAIIACNSTLGTRIPVCGA